MFPPTPSPSPGWGGEIPTVPVDYDPASDGAAILLFSMDSCPWCIRLEPVMKTVAATLGSVVPVYKVGPESPLTNALGVSGFPTIVYVNDLGVTSKFEGERTADAIVSFVCHATAAKNSVCTKYFS